MKQATKRNLAVVPASSDPPTPMMILSRAVAEGASTETLKELTLLVRDWKRDAAREAFHNARADAVAEIPVIKKDKRVKFASKTGGTIDYQFADFASIYKIVAPILGKHGLHAHFRTESPPGELVKVTCVISHRDGHSEENWLSAGRDQSGNKNDLQALGSTVTYLQRYTLMAALGLAAAKDGDGVSSSGDVARIDADQLGSLCKLIEKTALPADQFCLAYGIDAISDLPSSKYAEALRRLKIREQTIADAEKKIAERN